MTFSITKKINATLGIKTISIITPSNMANWFAECRGALHSASEQFLVAAKQESQTIRAT
jgi:hypothetical protein